MSAVLETSVGRASHQFMRGGRPVCLVGKKVNDPVEQHPVVAATNLH